VGVPAGRRPARRSVGVCCPGLRPGTRRGNGHSRSNSRSGGRDAGPGGAVWTCRTRRPTSDRSRRIFAVGRCRPWSTHIHATRGYERSDPLLILIFFFDFPWRTHTETVRGGAGWVRGGVRGMDAAAKPPRTGSRRPPRTHPARPSAAFALRGQAASHEGLRRWLKTQYRLIPGTVQPSICACADTAFSFSPRARRDCSIVAQ